VTKEMRLVYALSNNQREVIMMSKIILGIIQIAALLALASCGA